MEFLIAIIIAGILTLIILNFIFSNTPEDSRILEGEKLNEKYLKTKQSSGVLLTQKNPPQPPENYLNSEINSDQEIGEVDLDLVSWQELSLLSNSTQEIDDSEIQAFLTNLVGQKDRVSGEILKTGEKIYVCLACQLGYHEDSWYYLNQRCEQCKTGSPPIKSYILPEILSDLLPQTKTEIQLLDQIDFTFRQTIKY